jgi:ligand-binding SRPBCC domain-containing protein
VKIRIETVIAAPIERCFDAARDISLHLESTAATKERVVAGRTSGLIGFGETVTWEARHLGALRRHTSRITAFEPPRYFQDSMVEGDFRSFVHDHFFLVEDGGTRMVDVLNFRSPYGLLGRLVDRCFLGGYLRRFLTARALALQRVLEARDEPVLSPRKP